MNTESVGKLWLELFRFYTVGFKMADNVINIRQKHPMSKVEKTWNKKIAVEGKYNICLAATSKTKHFLIHLIGDTTVLFIYGT